MTTKVIEAKVELLKRRVADIERFDFGAIVSCPSPDVERFADVLEQAIARIFEPGHRIGDQLRSYVVSVRDEGRRPEWMLLRRSVAEIDRLKMYGDRIELHLDEIKSDLNAAIHELEEHRLDRLLSEGDDPHSSGIPNWRAQSSTVSTPATADFRVQARHEASRTLSRLNEVVRAIEAKRAHEGGLRSGPTVKMYAKAMVAALEEYLAYLIGEIATFAAAGTPRGELVEAANECMAAARASARANATITKLERTLGGDAPTKHLDQQGSVFDAHAAASLNRVGLGLPPTSMLAKTPSAPTAIDHDVFLSHASEDKADFVNGFAEALTKRKLKVWYDKNSMEWGKSVRQQLDTGLASSRFGVVVLSPAFFNKMWPQAELDALLNLETAGGNCILPILHKITHADLVKMSPLLSGKFARDTSKSTPDELANELALMCSHAHRGDT